MPFSNVGYSEINDRAATTYRANYDTSHEIEIGDIVNFTNNPASIKKLPRIDILTGGFPCQAFSMMGNMMGFEEDRGQMFFRIMDIVNIKKPKYLLLENVKNLLAHDGGRTYSKIKTFKACLFSNFVKFPCEARSYHWELSSYIMDR